MAFLSKHKESTSEPTSMELDIVPSTKNLAGIFCFLSKTHASHWIIDSGAMDHMYNSFDSFIFVQKILGAKHSITIPDGRKVLVDLCGDIPLMNGILLKKVLYV